MLHKAFWYVPDRILIAQHTGTFTMMDLWELYVAVDKHLHARQDDSGMMHVIMDLRGRTDYTMEMLRLGELSKVATRNAYNGWTIVVDPNPNKVAQFVGGAVLQMMKARHRNFLTMPDALAFLKDMDVTLPPLTDPVPAVDVPQQAPAQK